MKGSIWAAFASVILGGVLFAGGDLAAQGQTADAGTDVREVIEPLAGDAIGLGIMAMLMFLVVVLVFTGGDGW